MNAPEAGPVVTAIGRALVVAPDEEWADDVVRRLTESGAEVTHARDAAEASVSLAEKVPDLFVIGGSDGALRDHHAIQQAMQPTRDSGGDHDVPVVVIRIDDAPLDEDLFALLRSADTVSAADARSELLFRARVLIRRSQSRKQMASHADNLRQRARAVSSTVLASIDPDDIAHALVTGLGDVLATDYAMAVTFDNGQLPRVVAFWPTAAISPDVELADSQPVLRALANSLWATASMLITDPQAEWAGSPVRTMLAPWASKLDAATGVLVPIGQGESATGLVWIGSRTPRTWSPSELGALQSMALSAGASLLQSHLVVTLRHASRYSARMNKTHRDIISTISHELRTPLTSITGYLELIRDDASLPPDIGGMVAIVERNAHLLSALVNEVVDVSRVGTDDTHEATPVALGQLLVAVAADLRVAMEDRNLTCTVTADAHAIVLGNTDRLEQAISSIVHNAVKFSPLGGKLTLSVESDEHGCRLTASDAGIGIPEEDLPHIFDRFFRASNATASAIGGMGLGLSLVKQVVAEHQGTIDVRSRVGHGTTVVVQFD